MIGYTVQGEGNRAYRINFSGKGDLCFELRGTNDSFCCVAEVNYIRKFGGEGRAFILRAKEALRDLFDDKRGADEYVWALASGNITPLEKWREIREEYNLSSEFDVN